MYDLEGVEYSYQWIQVDADGSSNPADITGENAATYTLTAADEGKKVKVKVSFTDDLNGDEELTSAAFPSTDTVTTAASTKPTAADNTVPLARTLEYTFSAGDFGFDDTDAADMLAEREDRDRAGGGHLGLGGTVVMTDDVVPRPRSTETCSPSRPWPARAATPMRASPSR